MASLTTTDEIPLPPSDTQPSVAGVIPSDAYMSMAYPQVNAYNAANYYTDPSYYAAYAANAYTIPQYNPLGKFQLYNRGILTFTFLHTKQSLKTP